LVKLENRPKNRVITIRTYNVQELDNWTSELLDIIDAYGGSNPYPRLIADYNGVLIYSCTTKIPTINLEEFDAEIKEWRESKE
jgi:hypothetical protein